MHCYFKGSFCSVVASGTLHFYSFFPSMVLTGVDFWYDNYGLWARQAKARPKISFLGHVAQKLEKCQS